MKKLVLSFLAIPLLLPIAAVGQNNNNGKPSTAKSIKISGRVSEDGQVFPGVDALTPSQHLLIFGLIFTVNSK